MDPNNSGFIVEDALNESDFTEVSSIGGMDMKQMAEEIQKLKVMAMKNEKGKNIGDQSGMMQIVWQMGKEIGELKKKNEGIKNVTKMMDELKGLKEENLKKGQEIEEMKRENVDRIAKMLKAFEELKEEVEKLDEENGKLKDKNAEKCHEMKEMKKIIEELKVGKDEEKRVIEEFKEENAKLKDELAKVNKEMTKLKTQIAGKNTELEENIFEIKEKLNTGFTFTGLKAYLTKNSHEMEEIKKAIEELKVAKQQDENCAFEELKDENGRKLGEMAELIAQIDGKNAELESQIAALKEADEKLKEKMREMQEKIEELAKLSEKIVNIAWIKCNQQEFNISQAIQSTLILARKISNSMNSVVPSNNGK